MPVDRGAAAVEYGVLVALTAALLVVAIAGLGMLVRSTFDRAANRPMVTVTSTPVEASTVATVEPAPTESVPCFGPDGPCD